jgi:hypothetical protein
VNVGSGSILVMENGFKQSQERPDRKTEEQKKKAASDEAGAELRAPKHHQKRARTV